MYLFSDRITNQFHEVRLKKNLYLPASKPNESMYRILLTTLALAGSLTTFSQDSKMKIPNLPAKEDQIIVSISSDNWSGLPASIDAKPGRSRGFTILFMTDKMNSSGNFGIGAGLGFNSQNVHTNAFIADTTLNGSAASLIRIPDSLKYSQNKLSLNFLSAAVELRIRSNENEKGHRFKLSAGFMAGFLLQSHTKYKDKYGKVKTFGNDHLNKFQYGPTVRLGYSNFGLNGYYSLAELFKNNEGPVLNPYSIGLSFTF